MKIIIPKPCSQDWNQMTPVANGRYCSECKLAVRDFTNASDEEILSEMSNSNGKLCGNFYEDQLDRNLEFSSVNMLLTKFAVGLILTAGGFVTANAQENNPKICKVDTVRMVKGAPIFRDTDNTTNLEDQKNVHRTIEKGANLRQPLYVLDGIIISEKKFKKIDQSSIEAVHVLKGESATAIYGDKAKNGAIIITSKRLK